jgi:uncharacterized protein YggT (Ycf19 family)
MDNNNKQTEETVTTSSTLTPGQVVGTTTQTISPELSAPITESSVTTSSTMSPQDVVHTTKTVSTPEPTQKLLLKKKRIFRAYQVIWFVLAIIELLLAFRMVLKAVGANQQSGFATLILALSNPFAAPFNGILPTSVSGRSSFEWSILVAAAVYALVTLGIVQIIHMSKPVSKQEIEQVVDQK